MADSINKLKLQMRSGVAANGDKTPSPATKLLLNHGKPNFTIQRSPKAQQNGDSNPLTTEIQNNGNHNYSAFKSAGVKTNNTNNNNNNKDFIVQSTKFNGVFKPSNVTLSERQPHQQVDSSENEAGLVVLRRPKLADPPLKENEDEDVPEFIRRQRRIQERLAKENILDFENRRSGYFTHVVISPTSTNRTSFMETMSSPAVVPSLEMPPPAKEKEDKPKEQTIVEEEQRDEKETAAVSATNGAESNGNVEEEEVATNGAESNGNIEEEEVAKAIEEVNKAVAGEADDDKMPEEQVEQQNEEPAVVLAVVTSALIEEHPAEVAEKSEEEKVEVEEEEVVHATVVVATLEYNEAATPDETNVDAAKPATNGHDETLAKKEDEVAVQQNGHAANGSSDSAADDVTISHTNGVGKGPSLPTPDPSGALGVNYEPKTVVSFSKDLGSEPNKYPDTVKVLKDAESTPVLSTTASDELQEMAKLKFDIKADEQDVQVTPVLRAD